MIAHLPLRTMDRFGMGHYRAPRDHGFHNGDDMACEKGSLICTPDGGSVTKIGKPYYYAEPKNKKERLKNKLRYVQITTITGLEIRIFYVQPRVEFGERVVKDQIIGEAQDLKAIWGNDMTGHVHVEVKRNGEYVDPGFLLFPE